MIGLKTEIISRYTCFISIFLMQEISTVGAVKTTTVLFSLTTTTEATTIITTSTKSTEAKKSIVPHDFNSSATTLDEIDTTIPITTVSSSYPFGFSAVTPMPAIKVTDGTLNNTTSPEDQLTVCYPVEDLLTVTTETTQSDTALTRDATRTDFETSGFQVTDSDHKPRVIWVTDSTPEVTHETTLTEAPQTVGTTLAYTPRKSSRGWTFTLSLQASSLKVSYQTIQNTKKEPVKKEDASAATATNYKNAELLGYWELATKPFSKFLELLLERLTQLSDLICTRFILTFAHKMTRLEKDGNLAHFGPTIPQFIVRSADEVVKKPKEIIKGLIHSYYVRMLHRRELLYPDLNLLLDYMDMLYTYKEELDMKKILKDIQGFPENNRTVFNIVGVTISKIILKPSWRLKLSGKPRGRMLFEFMSKIISGKTDPNSDLQIKIANLTKRNEDFVKKNKKGRVKIVCETTNQTKQIANKEVTKAIKRRNMDFERAWTRIEERTTHKHSSKAYKTGNIFEHYNYIPTEAYWNVNRNFKMKRENLPSMRSQSQYPKSKFQELYEKYKRNKKGNIDSNIRQTVTFMGNNSDMAPFNLTPEAPKNNAAILGDNIQVHKYNATKTPNYVRMQPTTIANTANDIEFISFEIKNISNFVNIGMKLQFKKTARPQTHGEASPKGTVNFLATKAYNEPTVNAASSNNEVRIWNTYKVDKYFEEKKASVSNDAKQNVMLRGKSTDEVDKGMPIFDSHGAFTPAKGLEIPVLGEMKYTEITRKYNKYDEHAYRTGKLHAKRKRNKHKIPKLGRRESTIRQLRKWKDHKKKRREYKLRNYKRQRNYIKHSSNIDKYNRKNNLHIWDYYLKRGKETDQSDTENSLDSSQYSGQGSLLTEHEENKITSNRDNTNKMEILWYEKDRSIVDQSNILQSSKHSKGNKSYKKINTQHRIKEYEDVIKTFSEQLQNIKLSTQIQSNEHKLIDYVTKFQKKKPKYSYHTKKRLQKVTPRKLVGVDDIFRYTLLADIDRLKQQVGMDIEFIEDKYYKRITLHEKLPHIAKTTSSPKDRSVKSGSHVNKQGDKAHNLYIKDLKIHKNLIDVRRNVDDLKRPPQDAKDVLKFSTVNTLVDSAYSDEEKELKNNLYDALRHEDRKYFRRNLNHDSTPKSGFRDDSEYTDTEAVLKQKIYKSIKNMNDVKET